MAGAYLSGRAAGKQKAVATVALGYGVMVAAALVNLGYNLWFIPSVPWAIVPIFFYALGSAVAMPSISLKVLDLFPTRRGMAASLSGFVAGIVNTMVAGLLSPAVSHSPLWLSIGMMMLLIGGLLCWLGYLRLCRGR